MVHLDLQNERFTPARVHTVAHRWRIPAALRTIAASHHNKLAKHSMNTTAPLPPELEKMARRRASAKLGFFSHAFVYTVVITGLSLLAFSQGRAWSLWPAAGWGLGLFMHGLGVCGFGPGSALRERLLERERSALRRLG
jgi:hypothetical protein